MIQRGDDRKCVAIFIKQQKQNVFNTVNSKSVSSFVSETVLYESSNTVDVCTKVGTLFY